jgi:RecA/RadA recombinase
MQPIPSIPNILKPSETGLEYINSMTRQTFYTGVECLDQLHRKRQKTSTIMKVGIVSGSIVELIGGPRVGKTRMTFHVTSTFVLPRPLGGHGLHVIYLDMDGRFDANRLRRALFNRVVEIRGQSTESIKIQNSKLVEACLRRVLVIKCEDAHLVKGALESVKQLVDTYSVGLLVLSNLSGCFFDNRIRGANHSFGSMVSKYVNIICRECRIVTIAMTGTLFESERSTGHLLGNSWERVQKYTVKMPLAS